MNRAASASHQAGEGSAFSDSPYDDASRQPVDPFEDVPRGISHEEVGFGSLAFEDSVIVARPGEARSSRTARRGRSPEDEVARLRLARAFARN